MLFFKAFAKGLPKYVATFLFTVFQHLANDTESIFAAGNGEAQREFLDRLDKIVKDRQTPPWTFSMATGTRYIRMLIDDRPGCIKAVGEFGKHVFDCVVELAMNCPFVWGVLCIYFVLHFMTLCGQLLVHESVRRFANAVVSPFGQMMLVVKVVHCAMLHIDFWNCTQAVRETDCVRTSWAGVVFVLCLALNKSDFYWFRAGIQLAWAFFTHFVVFSLGVLVFGPVIDSGINATFEGAVGLNMTQFMEVHGMTNVTDVVTKFIVTDVGHFLNMTVTTFFLHISMVFTLFTNMTKFMYFV
jgi:hypothetical protein